MMVATTSASPIKVCVSLIVMQKLLQLGLSEVFANICINTDLINMPALEDKANVAYMATQLNIAPAQQVSC